MDPNVWLVVSTRELYKYEIILRISVHIMPKMLKMLHYLFFISMITILQQRIDIALTTLSYM